MSRRLKFTHCPSSVVFWNRWTEFNETWQEARSQRPLPSFSFFGPIEKKWPPLPLIVWDIFYFFSETAERNSTTLGRKKDLNVLYQVCVFRADRKKKEAKRATYRAPLASCQVSLNSIQRFQSRSRKCVGQSETGRSSCFSDRPEKQNL